MNPSRIGLMIGPSTGWMYTRGIYSLIQQERILKKAGVNSVEICLGDKEKIAKSRRIASLRERGGVFGAQRFGYRSLHLPDVNDQKPKPQFIATMQELVARCNVAVAVIHPLKVKGDYPREYYKEMVSSGIPLAFENMDPEKDSGFNPAELEELVTAIDCRFVLDVQHAYEHDPEMKYAGDLLNSLENRLAHLHVSGETDNNVHSLVHKATNAARIVEFVGQVLSIRNVPLILEGEYTTPDELQQEIEFLKKELGPVGFGKANGLNP